VKDLKFAVKGRAIRFTRRTTAGRAFALEAPEPFLRLISKDSQRASGLWLGTPGSRHFETRLRGVHALGKANEECRVESPWLLGRRKIVSLPHEIVLTEDYEVRHGLVKAEETRSRDFSRLLSQTHQCFDPLSVVYSR
jgi:hypothetical protein